ncbi:MAG: ATP synthase F1 subunit gamma [Polyangiales bacterium]
MPSLKAIRRRITSVKSTQKITRAMKMVAAARLRRAQQRITELRPYAQKTAEVLRSVAAGVVVTDDASMHPLLARRPVKTVLLLVLTSDRGLAGAFNSSITRVAERKLRELREEGMTPVLATLGRKGRDHLRRRGYESKYDFTGAPEGSAEHAGEIARALTKAFVDGEVDEVLVLFNEFKSAITQKPVMQTVLPIPLGEGEAADAGGDHIFEPSREALLDRLLPMYVEVSIYRAMLDSSASEHGARMSAMDSATNNAKKMIASLTLDYNRARQAAITKELMEIIGGAEAIKE